MNLNPDPDLGLILPPAPGSRLWTIVVAEPACRRCGGSNLKTLRTLPDAGDGSVSRLTRCRDCGETFVVLREKFFPDVGPDSGLGGGGGLDT